MPIWTLLSALLMGLIFFLSGRPEGIGTPIPPPWDKLAHLGEYLLLGYLLTRATGRPNLAWLLAAWFGAFDEVHQSFVPGREAGLDDWWFDLLGALIGSRLAGRALSRPLRRRRAQARLAEHARGPER